MKKLTMMVATGLAVAMLTALAACEKPVPAAQSAAASPQRLGHAGRWLTDDKGRAVILHGFNMVNKFPPSPCRPPASARTTLRCWRRTASTPSASA